MSFVERARIKELRQAIPSGPAAALKQMHTANAETTSEGKAQSLAELMLPSPAQVKRQSGNFLSAALNDFKETRETRRQIKQSIVDAAHEPVINRLIDAQRTARGNGLDTTDEIEALKTYLDYYKDPDKYAVTPEEQQAYEAYQRRETMNPEETARQIEELQNRRAALVEMGIPGQHAGSASNRVRADKISAAYGFAEPADHTHTMENARARQDEVNAIDEELRRLQEDLDYRAWQTRFDLNYGSYTRAEDFAEKSKYVSTANGRDTQYLYTGGIGETGYNDLLYELINGNEDAWRIHNEQILRGEGIDEFEGNRNPMYAAETDPYQVYKQMTEREVAIYNYLRKTDPQESVEYLNELKPKLNERNRYAETQSAREYAQKHPVLASLETVARSPVKAMTLGEQLFDKALDGSIDVNAPYNKNSYIPSAIRGEISRELEENYGKVGSFAYQTEMSMADNLYQMAVSGPAGEGFVLAMMGSGAAADTILDAKDRGLSDGEALALGITSGAIEIVTEKIGLDALFDGILGGKAVVRAMLQSALAEGGEEIAAEFLDTAADMVISGNNAELRQRIAELKNKGYSESEAVGKAYGELFIQAGISGLGGALSGFAMSGGGRALMGTRSAVQDGHASRATRNFSDLVMQVYRLKGFESGSDYARGNVQQNPSGTANDLRLPTPEEYAERNSADAAAVTERQTGTETTPAETAAEAQKTASTGETVKYKLSDDPTEQGNYAADAYDKIMKDGKGVTIPQNVLENYRSIRDNPAKKLMQVIKDYYDEVLKGTKVNVNLNGNVVEVMFENDGKKKSVGWRMKPEKAATFEYMHQMFDNAEYAYSQQNRNENERTSIPYFHYFITNANIDGKDVPVKLQVRDVVTGKGETETHYYTHNFQKNKSNDSPAADAEGTSIDSNAYVAPNTESASDGKTTLSGTVDTVALPVSKDSVAQQTAGSQEANAGQSRYDALRLPKVPGTETEVPKTTEDLRLPTPEEYAKQKNGTKPTAAETAAQRQAALDEVFTEETLEEEFESRRAAEEEYWQQQERDYQKAEREGKQIEREGITKTPKSRTRLKAEIQKIFSIQEGAKRDVNLMVDDIADAYMMTGSIPESFLDRLFDAFYNRGTYTQRADQYYEEFRRSVKGTKIYVNDSVRAEFGDDWGAFVRRARAEGITLTNNPADGGIDVHASALAEIFPRIEAGADLKTQLEDIVETSEQGLPQQLTQEELESAIRGDWGDGAVEARMDEMKQKFMQAVEVFEAWAQTEAEVRTSAEERIRKTQDKAQEIVRRQRTSAEERIRKAQDKAQEIVRRQMERRALSEMQQKTLKSLQWLKKNRNRAPTDLRARYDEVLKDIDTIAVGAANEMHIDNATGKTWRDLAQIYKDAKTNDPNFLPSKELENIIMRLDGTKIADMDTAALQDLYRAATVLRTEFYNRNNVINDKLGRTFAEAYDSSLDEIRAAKGITKKSRADSFFNEQQLTPMNVLRRMAGWKDGTFTSFAKGLESGERNYKGYIVKAKEKLGKFLEANRDWVKTSDGQGKNAVWYELEVPELLELGMGDKPIFGDTVKVYMTPAQKVYMALEAQNYDNLRHMTGGRTFVNKELYSKGDRAAAYANGTTVKLAPETVKNIVKDLTPQEKALYKVLHDYFNGMAKEEINAVSNPLYGYDKAIDSEYAPIYTNKNYVGHEAGKMDATVEGVGALKARRYSKNPSYNISAFDAFDRHVDSTARFVGYAIPIRNMQTLMNWRGHNTTMRDTITHKWLDTSTRYVDDLMTNLQQSKINDKGFIDNEVGKLLSNYVSGVFGANPGIVFKQFMSYPQFASQLGWSTMPTPAQFAKVDTDLISKYTPELDYRLLGYATPEVAAMRQNKNGITETKVGGFVFGGGAITAMDGFTVARAWPWAENYVRKNFPGLELGTQEQINNGESPFYRKVAEVYQDAVETTQPMYDTMHRANIMQSGNGIQRAFTMFKTVPLQQYNTLRRAFGELQQAKQSGNKAEYKAAAQTAANAVTATLASAVGLELVELLNQLWKNGAKGYRDDDDELTAESILKRVGRNVSGDLAGISILGKEASDFIWSKLADDKWWGIEIPGGEQLNDVIDTVSDTIDDIVKIVTDGFGILKNGGDLGEYFRVHGADYAGAVKDIAEKAALYLGGLPAENVEKYLKGTIRAAAPEIYTAMEDAFDTPGKSDLKGLEGSQLEKRLRDVLTQTYRNIPDTSVKELARMYALDSAAVQTDVPSSVNVNEEEVKLDASAQQRYSAAMERIAGPALESLDSGFYAGLDDENKIKYLRAVYRAAGDCAKREAAPGYSGDYTEKLDRMNEAGIGYSAGVEILAAKSAGSRAEFIAWVRYNFSKAEQENIFDVTNVSTKNYDTFAECGLKAEDIVKVTDLLEELADREKDPDKYSKALELLDSDFSDSVKTGAVKALLTDEQRSGYSAAAHNGLERQYIWALKFKSETQGVKDENGNTIAGSRDFELMKEIDTYNLTKSKKKLLYTACGGKGETMWDSRYNRADFEAYYYLSDSEREDYWEYCSDMTATKYSEYITDMSGMHNLDYNGQVVKSRQEQVVEYINGLNIEPAQKDALFLTQYKESGLAKTPWHQSRYEGLLLPRP